MRLVRQVILQYQEGSSDKVYEVDLCEVGAGRHVVNYRYGRRGATLREGTETPAPLPLADATRVFEKLVASKIKKGYEDVTGRPPGGPPPSPAAAAPAARDRAAAPPAGQDPSAIADAEHARDPAQARAIVARLSGIPAISAARRGQKEKKWPLERVIWRAGELGLPAAVPSLLRLVSGASAMREHCLAFALGRCAAASEDRALRGQVIDALSAMHGRAAGRDAVRRMAVEAMRLLSDEATRAEMAADLCGRLPPELSRLARSGPAEDFARSLSEQLGREAHQGLGLLTTLYLIDNEHVRPALLQILRTVPLQPNYFQRLRHLFKAAEYRRDAEVFGLLAYRFEKSAPMFRRTGSYGRTHMTADGSRLRKEEVGKALRDPAASLAFGAATRTYLRRRVWRTLRRLGEQGDLHYVNLAVGVLLPFTDEDAVPERTRESGYGRRREVRARWDAFAPYWAFNHVLHGRSRHFLPQRNARAFRLRDARAGGAASRQAGLREESFPQLWERRPEGLLHLLADSRCQQVHRFAATVLRGCRAFLDQMDVEAVIVLLGRPYEITAQLGYELARERYRPDAPDPALLLAVASSASQEGRSQAQRWIDAARAQLLGLPDFVFGLITSPQADTRLFARHLLRAAVLPAPVAQALIARIVAQLLALGPSPEDGAQARDIGDTLLQLFALPLRQIGDEVIQDLVGHRLREVQELGGRLVLNLADEVLLVRTGALAALAAHALPELRAAARPVVRRLAALHKSFGERMVELLGEKLLQPVQQDQEDIHRHVLAMLREDLGPYLPLLGRVRAQALCAAPGKAAQDLGGELLRRSPAWADEMDTADIVRLASHELRAVREAAWAMFERIVPRLLAHPEELIKGVRLLDAKWDDSREAAFALFRASFTERHLPAAILISICDSVREDVQRFGRELLTRFFQEEHGEEYLLRLSEHPSADLQLFATNYLERYAAGRPERLAALQPYFTSVLSRVNRAGVAKERIYAFLTAEARRDEAAARVAAGVLARVSATMSIRDRARCIEAMLEIRRAFPAVSVPLSIVEPPEQKDQQARHAL